VQPDTVFTPSQVIRGAPRPDYPDSLAETPRQARVGVACTIETTGVPTLCHIVRSGGAAFDREALRWLNGPNHPVYRPSTRGGNPVAEDHAWSIEFQP
jgi:protein TonB